MAQGTNLEPHWYSVHTKMHIKNIHTFQNNVLWSATVLNFYSGVYVYI